MPSDPPLFPELRSERLILRELTTADAQRMFEIHCNAEAMRWFGNDPMVDTQEALDIIEVLSASLSSASPHFRWAIVDGANPDAEFIGTCGLFGWLQRSGACRVGYELHPGAQGQGFMEEALRVALSWAFENRDLNRVVADIHPDNTPSRRLAERLGFVEEGVQREAGFWGERHHDLALYSLLRSDWS